MSKSDSSERLKRFAALAPQLLENAQAVCGMWLERDLRANRNGLRKHLELRRRLAGDCALPVTNQDLDDQVRLELERESQVLQAFQQQFALFHAAMGDKGMLPPWTQLPSPAWLQGLDGGLRTQLAGLIHPTGVVVDGWRRASACEVLEGACSTINLVVEAGQVPDRKAAAAYGSKFWGKLSTLVGCEVGALLRAGDRDGARGRLHGVDPEASATAKPAAGPTQKVGSLLARVLVTMHGLGGRATRKKLHAMHRGSTPKNDPALNNVLTPKGYLRARGFADAEGLNLILTDRGRAEAAHQIEAGTLALGVTKQSSRLAHVKSG